MMTKEEVAEIITCCEGQKMLNIHGSEAKGERQKC